MQIASLLFLVAAATAVPFNPSGDFWEPPTNYADADPYLYGPDVPQYGWFKGGQGDGGYFQGDNALFADPGADGDDSYFTREKAHISGFVQDALAYAASFLYDQDSDSFDFREWYNGMLEEFRSDQEDIDYQSSYDKKEDMDDFKDHLDQIASEFLEAQNNDYNDYVSDTVNDVWGKAIDQSQEIIARLQQTGYELNENEHQAGELYAELIRIGCGSVVSEDSYLPNYEDQYDSHQRMLALVDVTQANYDLSQEYRTSDAGDLSFFGEPVDSPAQCLMSQIFWEYIEINDELQGAGYYGGDGGHITKQRRHNLEDQQTELVRAFNKLRRKWRALRKKLDEVNAMSDHERKEITQLNKLLANLLTVDDTYGGPLGGVAIYDGARAARPRKLDGTWTQHDEVNFNFDDLYSNQPPYYPNLV